MCCCCCFAPPHSPPSPPHPIFLGITWLKLYCRRYMFKKLNTNEEKTNKKRVKLKDTSINEFLLFPLFSCVVPSFCYALNENRLTFGTSSPGEWLPCQEANEPNVPWKTSTGEYIRRNGSLDQSCLPRCFTHTDIQHTNTYARIHPDINEAHDLRIRVRVWIT